MGLFNAAGISRVRKVDREFQWLETILMNPVRTERMVVPAPDPENITELLETGADTYYYNKARNIIFSTTCCSADQGTIF